ncbi:MAG TPA: hypothetical protein VM051_05850 [Usitatibacter sp.]|nr:hypothetical protein [Usitatibacter sp.]
MKPAQRIGDEVICARCGAVNQYSYDEEYCYACGARFEDGKLAVLGVWGAWQFRLFYYAGLCLLFGGFAGVGLMVLSALVFSSVEVRVVFGWTGALIGGAYGLYKAEMSRRSGEMLWRRKTPPTPP